MQCARRGTSSFEPLFLSRFRSRWRHFAPLALLFFLVAASRAEENGDGLNPTQERIKNEILRLDGDWEPRLIGFIGPKFTQRHYEMLEHMDGVENLALMNLTVPKGAFDSIAKLRTLRWIEITDCKFPCEEIAALRRIPKLSKITIEGFDADVKLTKDGIESLSEIENLSTLELNGVEIPPNSVETLAKLKHLETLSVSAESHIDDAEIARVRKALPHCDVQISGK